MTPIKAVIKTGAQAKTATGTGAEPTGTPWPFDLLAEADRQPWLDKAEAELRENFGAVLWARMKARARGRVREKRAPSLYLASFGSAWEGQP